MLNVSDVSYFANIHSQYFNSATFPESWVALLRYALSQVCQVWRHGRVVNSYFDESLNRVPQGVKANDSGGYSVTVVCFHFHIDQTNGLTT